MHHRRSCRAVRPRHDGTPTLGQRRCPASSVPQRRATPLLSRRRLSHRRHIVLPGSWPVARRDRTAAIDAPRSNAPRAAPQQGGRARRSHRLRHRCPRDDTRSEMVFRTRSACLPALSRNDRRQPLRPETVPPLASPALRSARRRQIGERPRRFRHRLPETPTDPASGRVAASPAQRLAWPRS
jgi:hypothetical protein